MISSRLPRFRLKALVPVRRERRYRKPQICLSFLENCSGLSLSDKTAGEVGLPLEVILFRIIPAVEGHTQRLCNTFGINTGRVGLVIQRIGRRIPELGVIAELALLLLGQAGNGHLDLDLGGLPHAGLGCPGASARNVGAASSATADACPSANSPPTASATLAMYFPSKKSCSSMGGWRFRRSGPSTRSRASSSVVLPVLLSPIKTPCFGSKIFASRIPRKFAILKSADLHFIYCVIFGDQVTGSSCEVL